MRWSSVDAAAVKCLLLLGLLYGILSYGAYYIVHMRHVSPLGLDAPPDRFSEARTVEHVRRLSLAGGRQEGQPGLEAAAQYIKKELEALAERAGSNYRVEVEETLVSGAFNMMFLGHSISLGYRNHKNIVMRISSKISNDHDTSFLVNGHYDSALGSPGAGDCGSCVASMLELARLIVDSSWIPSRPVIFLFNGAEELFLLGSHGFVKSHRWSNTIGAFIDVEASGSGGFDLVVQSGPGSWPSRVYAQSAKYPMATSIAQDVFAVIPGDTDYRIFAQDYDNIPGLDIIFVLGGYFYHTSSDTVDKLLPGSIQARGENLFRLVQAFVNSSMLLNAEERSAKVTLNGTNDDRAVFFDVFSLFMVYYSKRLALVLHSLPAVVFCLTPLFLNNTASSWFAIMFGFIKGMLVHGLGLILAVILPIMVSVLRLLFSKHAMSWFAHPYLAFFMFVPSSLVGLFLPRVLWGPFQHSQEATYATLPRKALHDESIFWGAFGFYTLMTMAYLLAGFSGGFLTFLICVSMLIAWFFFSITTRQFGHQSLKSFAGYVIPLIPCIIYGMYFGGFLTQFLIEKMGMMGSIPLPYGYFVQDAIIATIIGLVTGWCFGPVAPVAGHWLARSLILQILMQITVVALALSSQVFPYSAGAPKRVVLQHTYKHRDSSNIMDSSYDFSVVDSNSLTFLFNYAPEAAKMLNISSEFSFEERFDSDRSSWLAIFPIPFLFSRTLKFPANPDDILKRYAQLPHLSIIQSDSISIVGHRRVNLELNLGSLKEVWVAVLNITGPLSNWSLADNILPASERLPGGPPSYVCRLSGQSHENWNFWLEANASESLRVDLAVLDQYLVDDAKKLKNIFPSWADIVAFSSFMSSYHL